jgi:two-component system, OmpR family, sensor histidine kinase KdpD
MDPDALLADLDARGPVNPRGRLKIFLGMCAGVGKTYAMLEAGRVRGIEGLDVVVGVVETHGRGETEALLLGHDLLPLQTLEYRGIALKEFDLDACLARPRRRPAR